jgi:uncharacterized protein (TIGR03067 family)
MIRLTSVAALILVLVASPGRATDGDDPRDAAKKDLANLQGAWSLVAMESEGRSLDPEEFEGWGAVYEGDRLTLKAKDQVRRRGIVTRDPTRSPKAINTWDLDGPFGDQTVPGIYALDGDTLRHPQALFRPPRGAAPDRVHHEVGHRLSARHLQASEALNAGPLGRGGASGKTRDIRASRRDRNAGEGAGRTCYESCRMHQIIGTDG